MAALDFIIPQQALNDQRSSTDPHSSVWVKANAGSGKTHILTQRVIRLLLHKTPPSKILCLTYTNAAAEVMKTRIFSLLKSWPFLSDEELRQELENMGHSISDDKELAYARRLFAKAVETPGGLKIQTIHAFCQAILQRFPLEANIHNGFSLLDDVASAALQEQARKMVLSAIFTDKNHPLFAILSDILPLMGSERFSQLIKEIFEKAVHLKECYREIEKEGSSPESYFRKILNIDNKLDYAFLGEQLCEISQFTHEDISSIALYGTKQAPAFAKSMEKARQLAQAAPLSQAAIAELVALLRGMFFTQKQTIRDLAKILGKELRERDSAILPRLSAKQELFIKLYDDYQSIELLKRNIIISAFAQQLLASYDQLKSEANKLDYDDLIYRCLYLLRQSKAQLWVQYKLDQAIDHILLDEAQDTDPAQWEIIQILAQEFFAGETHRPAPRSIFAVGDEKQAIYGFRSADPRAFHFNGERFKKAAKASGQAFKDISLKYSFRSSPNILKGVDKVFSYKENYQGLAKEDLASLHEPLQKNAGRIDIWPSFGELGEERQYDVKNTDFWQRVSMPKTAPEIVMASSIARLIAYWLQNKTPLPSQKRAIRAGDILILMRTRNPYFIATLTRQLKSRRIPVAGADSFALDQHIAIKDLLALGRFLLQTADNYSLACLFKSPLFALDEVSLYQLASDRGDISLWENILAQDLSHYPLISQMRERLQNYRQMVDTMPVFDFYSYVLGVDGARRAFIGRFGPEVEDILDEFLKHCLAYQEKYHAGMQGFIEQFMQKPPIIKREFDQERNEVRLLTVHGAKGLEAPIVFLLELNAKSGPTIAMPYFHKVKDPYDEKEYYGDRAGAASKAMLYLDKDLANNSIYKAFYARHLTKSAAEYRRLLYVGMTRAKEYLLLVTKVKPDKPSLYGRDETIEQEKRSWHDIVTASLKGTGRPTSYPALPDLRAEVYYYDEPLDKIDIFADIAGPTPLLAQEPSYQSYEAPIAKEGAAPRGELAALAKGAKKTELTIAETEVSEESLAQSLLAGPYNYLIKPKAKPGLLPAKAPSAVLAPSKLAHLRPAELKLLQSLSSEESIIAGEQASAMGEQPDIQPLITTDSGQLDINELARFDQLLSDSHIFSREAIMRGDLLHKLLQYLPNIKSSERLSFIEQFLKRRAEPLLAQNIYDELKRFMDDAAFQAYLDTPGLSEVNVKAHLLIKGRSRLVMGRIDRLLEQKEQLLIIDYKSSKLLPSQKPPLGHILQMSLYLQLLEQIYPQKEIKAALFYSFIPKITLLDNQQLKAVFARYLL